ncbi:MAG: carbohydrate-binding protein [Bacteroidales bacterium]|nr:carbohydrate-binding protein [Bacteroidales bacterium]
MKNHYLFVLFGLAIPIAIACTSYQGKPWEDKIQEIPGRVQCEFYDTGGEGISYHDADSVNNGSGRLNSTNGDFFNEFRMHEGVDISYTKTNGTDDNPYNDIMPEMNQLYVGWTVPGEWIKYTVQVREAGTYSIGLMYTANGDGEIEIVNADSISTGMMKVISTHKDADTLAWRQWHHWNKSDLGTIMLKKGMQIITLKTISNGNMNYDYLEFTRRSI